MMRDPITDAAQDPSCLLCLTPDRGGSWWSRLHPPTLRNFAESPETWTVFLQKLSEIALDDCEINLKLVPLQTSSAGVFWGIYFSSNNTQMVINSGTLTDNPLAVILTPSVNEPISIVIKRVGNSVEVLSNEVSKGKRSGNAIDLSTAELGNARSEFNGYLLNASLTNLTTGETLWQAAYSDLYDTSKPWPSSVPRNFMEEPETWYSFTPAYNSIGLDDFELDIVFDINACTEKYVFYDIAAKNGIGIYRGGNSAPYDFIIHAIHVITINEGEPFAGTAWRYNIGPEVSDTISGKFHVKITRIGTTVSCYANGNLVGSRAGTGVAPTNLTGNCSSNFDGSIQEVTLKNLTTGKIVWRYPTWEERTRLLTKTNVRTYRGAFEAANPAMAWAIKTALPAGITGTVLARINGECIVNPAQWNRTTATFTGASTDTLEFLTVFRGTLAYGQIAYICGVKRWVIPVSSGNINIVTVGFQGLRWTFPDGSTSTASSINQTVTAGTVVCEYVGLLNGQLTINNSTALASSAMRAIDLPRVTNTLRLYNLPGLTGSTADLPRVTNTLQLDNLPGLTGSTADLPSNTGERRVYITPYVTGALSVVATNTPIYYYATGATALEYDETVHNCVVAGGTGKVLHVGTGTSAGDADIQTLRDHGWSVTIH